MRKPLKILTLISLFFPITAIADYTLSSNRKCVLEDWGTVQLCNGCASSIDSACYEFSICGSTASSVSKRLYNVGETYSGGGNRHCTNVGFCEAIVTPIYVASTTVSHGLCRRTCNPAFDSVNLNSINPDGTCVCSYPQCTTPDSCEAGYIFISGTCVECPYIDGTGNPRGTFDTGKWPQNLTACYAPANVTYQDSTGSYRFDPSCYYSE